MGNGLSRGRFSEAIAGYGDIVTPYLSEQQLRMLESKQVSGVDLCGNGVIVVPNRGSCRR